MANYREDGWNAAIPDGAEGNGLRFVETTGALFHYGAGALTGISHDSNLPKRERNSIISRNVPAEESP
jgi:hypothetical protein